MAFGSLVKVIQLLAEWAGKKRLPVINFQSPEVSLASMFIPVFSPFRTDAFGYTSKEQKRCRN
jgi:hypothetical protein